jgi:hypothetical protein
MSSTVWAVPTANIWGREADIFHFLKDARCSVRIVEVRLFKRPPIRPSAYGQATMGTGR